MQTFLPYSDIQKTVECLDFRRLGKERVEARQILNCLNGINNFRWQFHPAVKMWIGFEQFLTQYMNSCIFEWIKRGYKNTMQILPVYNSVVPSWFGGRIHSTHRAALLYKDYEWYSQFGWTEEPKIEYFWPKEKTI